MYSPSPSTHRVPTPESIVSPLDQILRPLKYYASPKGITILHNTPSVNHLDQEQLKSPRKALAELSQSELTVSPLASAVTKWVLKQKPPQQNIKGRTLTMMKQNFYRDVTPPLLRQSQQGQPTIHLENKISPISTRGLAKPCAQNMPVTVVNHARNLVNKSDFKNRRTSFYSKDLSNVLGSEQSPRPNLLTTQNVFVTNSPKIDKIQHLSPKLTRIVPSQMDETSDRAVLYRQQHISQYQWGSGTVLVCPSPTGSPFNSKPQTPLRYNQTPQLAYPEWTSGDTSVFEPRKLGTGDGIPKLINIEIPSLPTEESIGNETPTSFK